jgi:hypothetical protein
MERALAATRKRHAHRLAASSNSTGTEFRNKRQNPLRNDSEKNNSTAT